MFNLKTYELKFKVTYTACPSYFSNIFLYFASYIYYSKDNFSLEAKLTLKLPIFLYLILTLVTNNVKPITVCKIKVSGFHS